MFINLGEGMRVNKSMIARYTQNIIIKDSSKTYTTDELMELSSHMAETLSISHGEANDRINKSYLRDIQNENINFCIEDITQIEIRTYLSNGESFLTIYSPNEIEEYRKFIDDVEGD